MTGDDPRIGAGLIDTNVVILLGDLNPEVLPDEPVISATTIAELSVGPLVTDNSKTRVSRQAHLQQAEADFVALDFDAAAARAFGRIAADLRSAGRKPAARAFDVLIAATALTNDLPLFTTNPADYAGIGGLEVVSGTSPARRAAGMKH